MTWNDVWKIVSALILSVGGAGAIITGIVKFSAGVITKSIEQKYEAKLDKELEKYKALLGEKTYVTRARFDTEFQAYQIIQKAMFECISTLEAFSLRMNQAIIDGNPDIFLGFCSKVSWNQSLIDFKAAVEENSAFIKEEISELYEETVYFVAI